MVFALCTALIVAMKGEFDRFYQRAANMMQAEQAYAYLRGAEDLATMALLIDYDTDKDSEQPRDDLGEIWAQPTTPYALDEGGWLVGSLEDLQGRFNLNSLVARLPQGQDKLRFTAAQAQFIRLLQALGEPAVSEQEAILITESIGDWLDQDTTPTVNGAEDDFYFSRVPAYRTANRPMASVSELRAVAYVTPEIYQAVQSWVAVWPQSSALLNIHTAPAMVLRSINTDQDLSPLSEADGDSLVDYRENSGFTDVDDFLGNAVFGDKAEQMAGIKALLGQSSSYFLLQAEVEVADRNMRLYSVLERRKRRIIAVARASGSL
ncbi:MAG: general secretion pathway protein GspK [Gammaproteobacteria bacterium]|nr:MAG: general secretion pathway protein GspK [Gammaproteobacteria bacterium]